MKVARLYGPRCSKWNDVYLIELAGWDNCGNSRLIVVHISQVSEFFMLMPVQVASRAHLSEQSWSTKYNVSFAVSNAHTAGPFCVFLDILYGVTWTAFRRAVTGFIITNSSSSGGDKIIWTSIIFTIVFYLLIDKNIYYKSPNNMATMVLAVELSYSLKIFNFQRL